MSMRIYFNNELEDVDVGDEVITTTSTFDYDNVAGTFASDLNAYADVDVNYLFSDYSEYDQRTCRNGGFWLQHSSRNRNFHHYGKYVGRTHCNQKINKIGRASCRERV